MAISTGSLRIEAGSADPDLLSPALSRLRGIGILGPPHRGRTFLNGGEFLRGRAVSSEVRIPTDGLRFRSPIDELEDTLKRKIQRAKDAGDQESVSLYQEVLALARKKAEALLPDGRERPKGGATGEDPL